LNSFVFYVREFERPAVNHLDEALSLMQEGKHKEASKKLEQAEEPSLKAEAYDVFLYVRTIKGHLMHTLGAYDEALKIHSLNLKSAENLLSKDYFLPSSVKSSF
jgi:hypothetical protein